jgi:hypothetical protein
MRQLGDRHFISSHLRWRVFTARPGDKPYACYHVGVSRVAIPGHAAGLFHPPRLRCAFLGEVQEPVNPRGIELRCFKHHRMPLPLTCYAVYPAPDHECGKAGAKRHCGRALARNSSIPNPRQKSSGLGRHMRHVAEKPPDFVAAILLGGEATRDYRAPLGWHAACGRSPEAVAVAARAMWQAARPCECTVVHCATTPRIAPLPKPLCRLDNVPFATVTVATVALWTGTLLAVPLVGVHVLPLVEPTNGSGLCR